jgi:hypothetical protein
MSEVIIFVIFLIMVSKGITHKPWNFYFVGHFVETNYLHGNLVLKKEYLKILEQDEYKVSLGIKLRGEII